MPWLGVFVISMLFLVVDLSSNLWYNTLHSKAGRSPDKPNRPSSQQSRDTPIYGALARIRVPIMVRAAPALVKCEVESDELMVPQLVTYHSL